MSSIWDICEKKGVPLFKCNGIPMISMTRVATPTVTLVSADSSGGCQCVDSVSNVCPQYVSHSQWSLFSGLPVQSYTLYHSLATRRHHKADSL